MDNLRIGHGFDVHRLVAGRKLIIGGVDIPFEKGLEGHSDADVLLHAIADALLGAAGLQDIGKHFPPDDDRFKDADSMDLLQQVVQKVHDAGFVKIVNVDCVILAERPKMSPHIAAMKARISAALDIGEDRIGVKASTTEKLGFTGREEGIAASAVCLVASNG
jgi:2-C-methyl-D-erythritol 2,4-cyclodiphosphate synthase